MQVQNEYKFLEQLGLHKNEARIYLEGLTIGTQATSIFAKKIGIPRSTTQVYLNNLSKRGFMIASLKKGIQFYTSIPPEELHVILEGEKKKIHQMENTLEVIMDLIKSHERAEYTLPDMSIFEGKGGLKKIYKIIAEKGEGAYFFRSPFYGFDRKLTEDEILEYLHILKSAEIPMRGLTHKYEKYSVPYVLEKDALVGFQRRFSEINIFDLPCQIILFGNHVAIITADTDLKIILIQEPFLTKVLENFFEYIWKTSLSYHERIIAEDDLASYPVEYRHYVHE